MQNFDHRPQTHILPAFAQGFFRLQVNMILSLPENLLASPSAQSKSDDLNNHMDRQTPLHYMAVTYMYTLYPSKLTLARLHVNNRNKQHQTAGRPYVRIKGLLSLCCILTFHVSAVVSVTYATEDSCSLRHTSSTSTNFGIIAAYRTTNESQNFPTNQPTSQWCPLLSLR